MQTYTRVYNTDYALGLNPTQSFLNAQTSGQIYYPVLSNMGQQQDWGRHTVPVEYTYRQSTLQYNPQDSVQDTRYKNVDMPSPVDSGIGADLSMMANPKEEFFGGDSLIERSTERALSHRDSPVVIPKV